nr:immunoglobulin light chain junction region [Macaca mulatta]
CLQGIQFPLTF